MPIAGEIHVTMRAVGLAQNGPKILEIKVAAIAKCPIRLDKVGIRDLRINIRMRRLPKQLGDRKGVWLKSEAHGQIGIKWKITARDELHLLPAELAQIHGLRIE